MANHVYNWKRFFIRFGEQHPLDSEGYLYDPDEPYIGRIYARNLVSLADLQDVRCLALLGEPGTGKSKATDHEFTTLAPQVRADGNDAFFLDLSPFCSDYLLLETLSKAERIVKWLAGNYSLHLFLDSLDECRLSVPTVSRLLLEWLKQVPTERLFLRIACRTFDWPKLLDEQLPALWKQDAAFRTYELCPLRQADVRHAVEMNGQNADVFCKMVDKVGAVAFATKPVTLQFLISKFAQNETLSSSQIDMFKKGCFQLCCEENPSRTASGKIGTLNAYKRLLIASRIAALTVLTNRRAVTLAEPHRKTPDSVHIREIVGGQESDGSETVDVTEEAVKETLTYGLFRGTETFSWAHQTYAEFLAAHYLMQNNLSASQILSLLRHPGDPDKKIVPQLYQTAAWIGSMVPEILQPIMTAEPEIVLQGDTSMSYERTRSQIVERLLKLFEEDGFRTLDYRAYRRLSYLKHSGLSEQLKPVLNDRAKNDAVRDLAIDISQAAKLQSLQKDLLSIALSETEAHKLRCSATLALADVANAAHKRQLLPLACAKPTATSAADLKGSALTALWPGLISAEKLFDIFSWPDSRISGLYHTFVRKKLPEGVTVRQLPIALDFLRQSVSDRHLGSPMEELNNSLVLKAWKNIDQPRILKAFVALALKRSTSFLPLATGQTMEHVTSELNSNQSKRQLLLSALFCSPAAAVHDLYYNSILRPQFSDFFWLIEQLCKCRSRKKKLTISELIWVSSRTDDARCANTIIETAQIESILAKRFAGLLAPLQLNSEANRQRLEQLRQEREWKSKIQERQRVIGPPPQELILNALEAFEGGNLLSWITVCRAMELLPDSRLHRPDVNLIDSPGWEQADKTIRNRILAAACKYLRFQKPIDFRPRLGRGYYPLDREGYRALSLLGCDDSSALTRLSPKIWKKWTRTVIHSAHFGKPEHADRQLFKVAYKKNPSTALKWFLAKIDQENRRKNAYLHILANLEPLLDSPLKAALYSKLNDKKLNDECFAQILALLIRHKYAKAISFAKQLVIGPPNYRWTGYPKAIRAAICLCQEADDAGWDRIWPAIQRNRAFGRALVMGIVSGNDRDSADGIVRALSEDQVAELYLWLTRTFKRPKRQELGTVKPRHVDQSVEFWRSSLITHLREAGTSAACSAIKKIMSRSSNSDWLSWTLFTAQQNTRRKTWQPPSTRAILALARMRDCKIVQNSEQLLELVLDSLNRLEKKLQDEGKSEEFYHRAKKDQYSPVDEKEFARRVKRFLKDDLTQFGIFLNCEPEIRMGQRADIQIEAVTRPNHQLAASVIVEAKGSWNAKELDTAMDAQLKKRYLVMNGKSHGIYLVGWFHHASWAKTAKRHNKWPLRPLADMRSQFAAQAKHLSTNGIRIEAFVLDVKWTQ